MAGSVAQSQKRLAEIFSSKVRAEVLTYLFARREAAASLTELARALGLAISSVQHEVYKLERLGILTGRREGNSRRYRLTLDTPVTEALEHLVHTALGIESRLAVALQVTPGLSWGTVAAQSSDSPETAVLILVGSLALNDVAEAQTRVASALNIPVTQVRTSFFSPETWTSHVQNRHPSYTQLESLQSLAETGSPA